MFTNYWRFDEHMNNLSRIVQLQAPKSSGRGFTYRIPGGLPAKAESVLEKLSTIDELMSKLHNQSPTDEEQRHLGKARNAVQHDLLCLRPWEELQDSERLDHTMAMYECCRLTSLIYSNAIVFPLPLNSGWHRILLKRLRSLFELSRVDTWTESEDASAVALWSLYIGAMGAYDTRCKQWFQDSVRQLVKQDHAKYQSYTDLEAVFRDFLWTDAACGLGGRVVWADLRTCLRDS